MIDEIVIRDLGVIGEARLELGRGFTALTGETGAGKTMVLSALGLLLGNRSDSSAIRSGQSQAEVHGRWVLPPAGAVTDFVSVRLAGAEIPFAPDELVISRTVSADGKSRAAVSARPVPASLLAELGDALVVVHGQAEQIRLKSAAAQRQALDGFGGAALSTALTAYELTYQQWRTSSTRLAELRAEAANRLREADDLRHSVSELEQADPKAGEDVELASLAERLTNTQDIRQALATAHEALSSEEVGDTADVLGLLSQAKRALEHGATFDPRLNEQAESLQQIGFTVREVAAVVSTRLAELEEDSELSLDEIQERRAVLGSLMRRYGPTLDEVIAYRGIAATRLLDLDSSADQISELEIKVETLHAEAVVKAETVTELRTAAAEQLAEQVTAELQALAMPGASLEVKVTPTELGPNGADDISIQLSSYPGAEARPLGKGASGGELSRIMLAIEVVLAKGRSNPTFIFDEVDAGVGGAAAIEIGKRLARLAEQAQVIVVTHLAQVAAYADTHLRVLKNHNGEYTVSDVVNLTEVARVEELARMLSGMADSELARAHAAELWQSARASRKG